MFVVMLCMLVCSNATMERRATGAGASCASPPPRGAPPAQSGSSRRRVSSTAPASPTSTASQVTPSGLQARDDSAWGVNGRRRFIPNANGLIDKMQIDTERNAPTWYDWRCDPCCDPMCCPVYVRCRLEHVPAQRKCRLWAGFTVPPRGLCS